MSTQLSVSEKTASVKVLLDKLLPRIQEHAVNGIDPAAFTQTAYSQVQLNPSLLECDQQSLWQALLQAHSMGLVPNGRHGHLLPYNDKRRGKIVQFIPDYKGMIHLAYQNFNNVAVSADVVKENDKFSYERGTSSHLRHTAALKDRGETLAAWAMVEFSNGHREFIVMDMDDINKRKAASMGASSAYSPWAKWPDEMAKKTVLKALCKVVPLGPGVETAVSHDTQMDIGEKSQITTTDKYGEMPALDHTPIDADFTVTTTEEPTRADEIAEQAKKKKTTKRKQTAKKPEAPTPVEDVPVVVSEGPKPPKAEGGGPSMFEQLRDEVLSVDPAALDPVEFKILNAKDSKAIAPEQAAKLQTMIDDARRAPV